MTSRLSTWRIVVAEEDCDDQQPIACALRERGAEVYTAQSERECVRLVETVAPHVVIMDLALPSMDGWQTLSRIRAEPSGDSVPVVAVTSYHSTNLAQDARRAGFDAYFPKPIEVNSFVEQIVDVVQGEYR